LGQSGARQQCLVQFVTEAVKGTVLGVDFRQVNRVRIAPFKETHAHHCTEFGI
jgi:hypothetical protein